MFQAATTIIMHKSDNIQTCLGCFNYQNIKHISKISNIPCSTFESSCTSGSCNFVGSPPLATLSRSSLRHICSECAEKCLTDRCTH